MKITEKSHPYVFEVFQAIDHDSGRSIGRGASPVEYNVPDRCEEFVRPAERALAGLTADERQTVAIGEESEATALIRLVGSDGDKLEKLLGEYFETEYSGADWSASTDLEGP